MAVNTAVSVLSSSPVSTLLVSSSSLASTAHADSPRSQSPSPPLSQLNSSASWSSRNSLPLRAGSITFLECKHLRFVIHDCPSDSNLMDYVFEFKKHNVTDVVRVCERSYSTRLLEQNGIQVHVRSVTSKQTMMSYILVVRCYFIVLMRILSFQSAA
jgi:hypothetical protein